MLFVLACSKKEVAPANQLIVNGIYVRQNNGAVTSSAGMEVQWDGTIGKIINSPAASPFKIGQTKWKNVNYTAYTISDLLSDGTYGADTKLTVSGDGKTVKIADTANATELLYILK